MRRKLFTFACFVSTILCIAALVLWMRSYSRIDSLSVRSLDDQSRMAGDHTLRSVRGAMLFEVGQLHGGAWYLVTDRPHTPTKWIGYSSIPGTGYEAYTRGVQTRFGFGGASYPYVQEIDAGTERLGTRAVTIIPMWAVALVTAILPVAWGMGWTIERRRKIAGGCRSCGYDLTGNTSGVCPECGAKIDRREESKTTTNLHQS